MDLWLDLETRSRVNLPKVGVYVYTPACELMLCSWAVDNGLVHVDETVLTPTKWEQLTPKFWDAFAQADRIIAHNAEFDRTVLQARFPGIDIRFDRWYCTMAQARRHGLPGSLDTLCDVLGVPSDKAKMKDSRALLMMFCKPTKEGKFNDKHTHPAEWARFVQYGGLDVEAMREVHKRAPKWNDAYEAPIWLADQRVNSRGFEVDTQFAAKAVAALQECAEETDDAMADATGGSVESGRQVASLLAHLLEEHGVDLPDMQAATIERRLKDDNLPGAVRELLALRQQSAKTSTSKYATLLRCVNDDGRLRGVFTYSGAMRTQRWAANRFQAHNMPRPVVGKLRGELLKTEIARGIDAVKAGVYDLVGSYPLPEVLASAVRGCVVAPRGKRLTIGDYANVEGRGLAWLAGEEWKLQAFRDYDAGTGPDLYKLAYGNAFGMDPDDVDDGQERQVGKVMELMLGYGGGVGAFVTGAATYRVDLAQLVKTAWPLVEQRIKDETARMWAWAVEQKRTYGLDELTFRTCDALKRVWREAHPMIVKLWSDLDIAFQGTAQYNGRGLTAGQLKFDKVGAWVRIQMPSGRYLSYPGAHVTDMGKLRYKGLNQYTRQWGNVSTYGGKLAENVTQALCRDLLAEALVRAQDHVVLHVHDELVGEDVEPDALRTSMLSSTWATGLPLAVATYQTERYHKD